jgi:hypothetical protein
MLSRWRTPRVPAEAPGDRKLSDRQLKKLSRAELHELNSRPNLRVGSMVHTAHFFRQIGASFCLLHCETREPVFSTVKNPVCTYDDVTCERCKTEPVQWWQHPSYPNSPHPLQRGRCWFEPNAQAGTCMRCRQYTWVYSGFVLDQHGYATDLDVSMCINCRPEGLMRRI